MNAIDRYRVGHPRPDAADVRLLKSGQHGGRVRWRPAQEAVA